MYAVESPREQPKCLEHVFVKKINAMQEQMGALKSKQVNDCIIWYYSVCQY